jgi:MraZ protein
MDWMEQLSSGVNAFDFFSDEHDTLTAALFSQTEQLSFDGEGRIILPTSLVQHANINKEAAFVGRGPTFEIWEPQAFNTYQNEATKKAAEQQLTLRPSSPPGINGGKS